MVERNTDSEQSLIFLKDSEVTRILWAWRSRETRDSCLASLPLHALRVGQRQDTLLLMRYKRFNGYLDYLSTFIYMVKICLEPYELMSVLFGTKCIWKKKNTKKNKSCLQHEVVCNTKHAFALRLSLNAYYDTLMHMYDCSQKSSDNLPAPTPHPAPHHWPVLFSLSGWSAITFMR